MDDRLKRHAKQFKGRAVFVDCLKPRMHLILQVLKDLNDLTESGLQTCQTPQEIVIRHVGRPENARRKRTHFGEEDCLSHLVLLVSDHFNDGFSCCKQVRHGVINPYLRLLLVFAVGEAAGVGNKWAMELVRINRHHLQYRFIPDLGQRVSNQFVLVGHFHRSKSGGTKAGDEWKGACCGQLHHTQETSHWMLLKKLKSS